MSHRTTLLILYTTCFILNMLHPIHVAYCTCYMHVQYVACTVCITASYVLQYSIVGSMSVMCVSRGEGITMAAFEVKDEGKCRSVSVTVTRL